MRLGMKPGSIESLDPLQLGHEGLVGLQAQLAFVAFFYFAHSLERRRSEHEAIVVFCHSKPVFFR
jgi:hypothetical protein